MKICFMCDLHLPEDKNARQYKVLDWAISDAIKKDTDCLIFAGDATCNGNGDVYDYFINKFTNCGIQGFFIPGNSDLRDSSSAMRIKGISSDCENELYNTKIFAVNDSDGEVSEDTLAQIEKADEQSIVFMHHPIEALGHKSAELMTKWRESHKKTKLFFGHNHISVTEDNDISLQAMDTDKAIGENACITYYDTVTQNIRKAYYFCPVPADLYGYMGISCYKSPEQINYATDKGIANIELRPNCAKADFSVIHSAVSSWRESGGTDLSIHMPDISYINGEAVADESFDKLIELAKTLKNDRFTIHVPKVSVQTTLDDSTALEKICDFLADRFNSLEHNVVIGIENMHMTASEMADNTRRFGYIPGECELLIKMLSKKCRHKVGFNFDIGHARNNAPYSSEFQISSWLSKLGRYIVGYHIHQVTYDNEVFENHMPITDIYGRLISYGTLFADWSEELINKAPFIFEMRPEGSYDITYNVFDSYKNKKYFDIHSHTYYSDCGRDDPHDLIKMAIRNGMSVLGISDHAYGIKDRKPQYEKEFRDLAEQYADRIKVLCGIEINTIPRFYDEKDAELIKNYDYCLIECINDPESVAYDDFIGFCKKFDIPCGIAHTDLFAMCEKRGYDPLEYFTTLAENNIFWEMNVTYDSIHQYREHPYVIDFMNDSKKLEIVKKSGVCVSIGLDSHRYEDYDGYKAHYMYDFLVKNGIRLVSEIIKF